LTPRAFIARASSSFALLRLFDNTSTSTGASRTELGTTPSGIDTAPTW